MAKLIVYYSRADENYFGGDYRYVEVGNTEKAAKMIAEKTGAELARYPGSLYLFGAFRFQWKDNPSVLYT